MFIVCFMGLSRLFYKVVHHNTKANFHNKRTHCGGDHLSCRPWVVVVVVVVVVVAAAADAAAVVVVVVVVVAGASPQ